MVPRNASRRIISALATVCGCATLAVIAAGCGDDGKAQARAAEASARNADVALCATQLEPLQTALTNMKADLGVGINYSAYAEQVRGIARAYAKVDSKELGASSAQVLAAATGASTDSTCIGAAASFENAFNAYTKANTIWGDCIENIATYGDCTSGPVNTRIQAQWSKASSATSNGETQLTRLTTLAERASAPQE